MLRVCIDPVPPPPPPHAPYAAHITFFLVPRLSIAQLNCGYSEFGHRDARTLYLEG
jgi:hypothetical protein